MRDKVAWPKCLQNAFCSVTISNFFFWGACIRTPLGDRSFRPTVVYFEETSTPWVKPWMSLIIGKCHVVHLSGVNYQVIRILSSGTSIVCFSQQVVGSLRSTTRLQWRRHKICILNCQKQKFCTPFTCFFLIPCISFKFSANLRREMTISQVLQRTWTLRLKFEYSF